MTQGYLKNGLCFRGFMQYTTEWFYGIFSMSTQSPIRGFGHLAAQWVVHVRGLSIARDRRTKSNLEAVQKNLSERPVRAVLLTFCGLIGICAGCAVPPQKSASDNAMKQIVYAEGRGSNPDSAGHINRPDRPSVYFLPSPKPLEDFQLTDDRGKPFNRAALMQKWTFLYFGYTHCPDVCPMTMSMLNQVYFALSSRPDIQSNTRIMFISVDPVRDTPRTLRSYIEYFNKDFLAAVGSEKHLDDLTDQLDAKHQILYSEQFITHEKKIRVLHDSAVYLIDPLARLFAIFTPPITAERIKDRYVAIRIARNVGK